MAPRLRTTPSPFRERGWGGGAPTFALFARLQRRQAVQLGKLLAVSLEESKQTLLDILARVEELFVDRPARLAWPGAILTQPFFNVPGRPAPGKEAKSPCEGLDCRLATDCIEGRRRFLEMWIAAWVLLEEVIEPSVANYSQGVVSKNEDPFVFFQSHYVEVVAVTSNNLIEDDGHQLAGVIRCQQFGNGLRPATIVAGVAGLGPGIVLRLRVSVLGAGEGVSHLPDASEKEDKDEQRGIVQDEEVNEEYEEKNAHAQGQLPPPARPNPGQDARQKKRSSRGWSEEAVLSQ